MFTKDKQHNFLVVINYMTTSNTYDILDIKELIQDKEDQDVFYFTSNKYDLNEKFRSLEVSSILRVFNEMKEKALKTTSKGKYDDEIKRKKVEMGKKMVKNLNIFDF